MKPLTIEQRDEILEEFELTVGDKYLPTERIKVMYLQEWLDANTEESKPEPNKGKICKHCAHYELPHFICNIHNKDTGETQWCDKYKEQPNRELA
jgi:hypothetical protein